MSPTPPRRDPRPYIYAAFSFALAVLYLVLFRRLIPSTQGTAQAIGYSMSVATLAMGVALLLRHRAAWWVAAVGSGYMLLVTIALFFLVIHSAAFLAGVYGAFGKGAASMAYLAAALIIEAVGLIPALLLKFLMTRAGRRLYGLPPLRSPREVTAAS